MPKWRRWARARVTSRRLVLGRIGCGHVGEAAVVEFGQIDLAGTAQIEHRRDVIQTRVPLHARGDGQGGGVILGAPQDGGVERPLMQIVEGGVGRRRGDHLAAEVGQGIGQGEEMPVRLAGG